jgi:hypothetical protein
MLCMTETAREYTHLKYNLVKCNLNPPTFQNSDDQDIQNHIFATYFLHAWNVFSYFEGRTQKTNVWEPRKIFQPRKNEVSEQFRILHNGKLHHLHRSNQTGWSRGNALDLHSGGAMFNLTRVINYPD